MAPEAEAVNVPDGCSSTSRVKGRTINTIDACATVASVSSDGAAVGHFLDAIKMPALLMPDKSARMSATVPGRHA
eukprot:3748509-Pyramimonas_sp.AAC.1